MNIIIIAEVNFPEGMAATAHVTLMAKGLIENGTNVLLAIPSKEFNANTNNPKINEGVYQGIPYKFFNHHDRNNRNIKDISRYIIKRRKGGYSDAIICYTNDLFKYFSIFFTCFRKKIPMFPWIVERMSLNKNNTGLRKMVKSISPKLSERIIHLFSKGIIVISSRLKQYYGKYLSSKSILVSPILVDHISEITPGKDLLNSLKRQYEGERLIVYSGSFGEKEGIKFILEAFSKASKSIKNIHLVMTGTTGNSRIMNELYNNILKLKIEDKIDILGLVSREELKRLNKMADLLLACRSNSEYANYGFPWKIGEYAMTANPILATPVSDIPLYFKDEENIFFALPEDSDSIANRIVDIFENYDISICIAEKCKETAIKRFNYLDETKKVINFIRSKI